MPGSFLGAVLENDLKNSWHRADPESWTLLHTLLTFMHNEMPTASWGSPERVRAYIAWKRQELTREKSGTDTSESSAN